MFFYPKCHKLVWRIPHLHKTHSALGGSLLHLKQRRNEIHTRNTLKMFKNEYDLLYIHTRETFEPTTRSILHYLPGPKKAIATNHGYPSPQNQLQWLANIEIQIVFQKSI